MRTWLEGARTGYRQMAAYPMATVAGVFTNSVFGIIRASIFVAVYRSRTTIGGYDLTDAITYTFLSQALITPMALWGWTPVAESIRTGQVVVDLYRPMDHQAYWLAVDAGRFVYHLVWRGLPPLVVGAFMFDLRVSPSWPVVVVALLTGWLVSFQMRYLMNLSAFWLLDHRGVSTFYTVVITFLSGQVLPLRFFPPGLRTVAGLLPFAACMQVPIDMVLGRPAALWPGLVWLGVLGLASRGVLAAATRRVVVHGG